METQKLGAVQFSNRTYIFKFRLKFLVIENDGSWLVTEDYLNFIGQGETKHKAFEAYYFLFDLKYKESFKRGIEQDKNRTKFVKLIESVVE